MDAQKKKILVVDDKEINRVVLEGIFQEDYNIVSAENGKEALAIIERQSHDLEAVLLDVFMPVMDGFEVLEYMKDEGLDGEIPVVLITAEDSADIDDRAYQYNVADIVRKPFVPRIVRRRVYNVINLYSNTRKLEKLVKKQARELERKNADYNIERMELEKAKGDVIDAMCDLIERRNKEPYGHVKRVKEYTRILASELAKSFPEYDLTDDDVRYITDASVFHDLGKIAISEAIVCKPTALTDVEFEESKMHTIKGCEILETFNFIKNRDFYRYSKEICRSHHEKWDGKGYPDALVGDEIPISAQVVSLADTYDAMTVKRGFKEAFDHEIVMDMINCGNCGSFNPKLITCFNNINEKFKKIMEEVSDVLI